MTPKIAKDYILAVSHDYYNAGNTRTLIMHYRGNLKQTEYDPYQISQLAYRTKDQRAMLELIGKVMKRDDMYLYGIPCTCTKYTVRRCKAKFHNCICGDDAADDKCMGHGVTERGIEPQPDPRHELRNCEEKAVVVVLHEFSKQGVAECTIRRHINIQCLKAERDRYKRYGYIVNKTIGDSSDSIKKNNEKRKDTKHCECCNKDIAVTNWSKHIKSKRHAQFLKDHNIILIKMKAEQA